MYSNNLDRIYLNTKLFGAFQKLKLGVTYSQIRYSVSIGISLEDVLAVVISRFQHSSHWKSQSQNRNTYVQNVLWQNELDEKQYVITRNEVVQHNIRARIWNYNFAKISIWERIVWYSNTFEYIRIINYSYSYSVIFSDRIIFVFVFGQLFSSNRITFVWGTPWMMSWWTSWLAEVSE